MIFGSGAKPPLGNVDLKISHQLRFNSNKKKNLSPIKENKENQNRPKFDRKNLHSHPITLPKNDLFGESFRPKPTAVENVTKYLDFSKKLNPLNSIVGDITFDEGYTDNSLEKIVNMMNLDSELYYLASSFSHYLKHLNNENEKKVKPSSEALLKRNPLSQPLNEIYKRPVLPPIKMGDKRRNLSEKKIPFESDISIIQRTVEGTIETDINADSGMSLGAYVKNFSKAVPIPFDKFKDSLANEMNGFSPAFRFFKLSIKTNFRAPMDLGFIELEVLQERRSGKILKLYIFKIFRQMTLSEELHKKIFDKVFETVPEVEKLIIRVLAKYESYKGFLLKCGFTLEKRILLDNNEFDIMIKRK